MRKILLIVPALLILTFASLRLVSRSKADVEPAARHDIWNTPTSLEISAVLVEAFGPDASNIVVGFDRNVAVLSGDVSERATQSLADELAESVDGVIVVHNFIDVRGIDDSDTRRQLALRDRAFGRRVSSDLPPDIEVAACDGVVLLRGVVPDDDRHETTLRLAESLTGVTRVIDRLHVTWTSSVPAVAIALGPDILVPVGIEK